MKITSSWTKVHREFIDAMARHFQSELQDDIDQKEADELETFCREVLDKHLKGHQENLCDDEAEMLRAYGEAIITQTRQAWEIENY